MLAALTVPATPAVAACTLSGPAADPAARSEPPVDPDVRLLGEVAAATDVLVGLYESVLDEHRDLRRDLRPLLAAHRAHAGALGDAAPRPGATGSGTGRRSTPTPSAPEPADVPRRPAAAVRVLRDAEQDASRDLLTATADAASGPFAQLLASMSAACAQHVRVLAGVGVP